MSLAVGSFGSRNQFGLFDTDSDHETKLGAVEFERENLADLSRWGAPQMRLPA